LSINNTFDLSHFQNVSEAKPQIYELSVVTFIW